MSIRRQYLKTKPVCKVTFRIPESIGAGAERAWLLGEFNDWSRSAHPMRRLKTGAFTLTVDLEPGRDYQFRYLMDQTIWANDPDADDWVPTPFGESHNSLICL
jgi:1,4-alpha-glucan branching enzyme